MDGTKSAFENCFKESRTIFDACMLMDKVDISVFSSILPPKNQLKECNKIRNRYECACVKMNMDAAAKARGT